MPIGPRVARYYQEKIWLGLKIALGIVMTIVALVLLGWLGVFDFEFWAFERGKPSPHYLGPPRPLGFKPQTRNDFPFSFYQKPPPETELLRTWPPPVASPKEK